MGKLKNIEVTFSDGKKIYYPGNTVSGNITLESRGELQINSLKVLICGISKVHLKEPRSDGFRSEFQYFCMKKTLVSNQDLNNMSEKFVCNGVSVFPFQFALPQSELDTSFEGKHGYIRYYLKVELDQPWSFNYNLKKMFTVIKPININELQFLEPVYNESSKTVCCFVWASGPVKIHANTDRRGYCPGEFVFINALFDNNSNRAITPRAFLVQTQKFITKGKSTSIKSKLKSITGDPISSRESKGWVNRYIKIPAVSPTINSALIKIEYFIQISIHIPGSKRLKCILPIILGTTPRVLANSPVECQFLPTFDHMDSPPAYEDIEENQENIDPFYPLYTYVLDDEPPSYDTQAIANNYS